MSARILDSGRKDAWRFFKIKCQFNFNILLYTREILQSDRSDRFSIRAHSFQFNNYADKLKSKKINFQKKMKKQNSILRTITSR